MLKFIFVHFILCCMFLGVWSGCQSPRLTEMQMPPGLPASTVQTSKATTSAPQPGVENAAQPLPDGIILKLKGKEVDFSILERIPDPQNRTVKVLAKTTLPYKDVSEVLDRLHALGFLIFFEAQE